MRHAQIGASFVPGAGTGVSAALGAANALADGSPINDAAIEAARGAIPGGRLPRRHLTWESIWLTGKTFPTLRWVQPEIVCQQVRGQHLTQQWLWEKDKICSRRHLQRQEVIFRPEHAQVWTQQWHLEEDKVYNRRHGAMPDAFYPNIILQSDILIVIEHGIEHWRLHDMPGEETESLKGWRSLILNGLPLYTGKLT